MIGENQFAFCESWLFTRLYFLSAAFTYVVKILEFVFTYSFLGLETLISYFFN